MEKYHLVNAGPKWNRRGALNEPILAPEAQLLNLRLIQLHRLVAVIGRVCITKHKSAKKKGGVKYVSEQTTAQTKKSHGTRKLITSCRIR
jgi:hypothetical protein